MVSTGLSANRVSQNTSFGGIQCQYTHQSSSLNCEMRFAIYLPPQATENNKVPVVYWLSGLTCNDENFMQKAGALGIAAELGIAIVAPDTSPRGDEVPDDINKAWDFGLGAGFYLNATQEPWRKHYQMYDYVLHELPTLIEENFSISSQRAISGHSMGGHGALVLGLRNPGYYSSVTAFSPINNPINCPWGKKAFNHYLGGDQSTWQQYDASVLMAAAQNKTSQNNTTLVPALVDQGSSDVYLQEQLKPDALIKAAEKSSYPLQYRMQLGYDHSYYFISSFIEEHLRFHNKHFG